MKLINGRGQLGEMLKYKICDHRNLKHLIYHTWNIEDKSEKVQQAEYKKFCDFVDENRDGDIVFISTLCRQLNPYTKYKTLSEMYLYTMCPNGRVIKIPALIGKGNLYDSCAKGEKPFSGKINISTLDNVSSKIIESLYDDKQFVDIEGDSVDVNTIYELIQYGKKHVG